MTDDALVERVARALVRAWNDNGGFPTDFDRQSVAARDNAFAMARAAIETVRADEQKERCSSAPQEASG